MNENMKKAYIENILIWVTIFCTFVLLFFFVIKFATIIRIKDNLDAMSDYIANKAAVTAGIGDTTINGADITKIVAVLNNMKVSAIAQITDANLSCADAGTNTHSYQINSTVTTGTAVTIGFYTNTFTSNRVVYNEMTDDDIDCTLTISLN